MKYYPGFPRSVSLALSVLVLTACSSGSVDTPQFDESVMLFEPCQDILELDCGSFEVPLIHESSDSRRIRIDVARMPGIGSGPHEPLLLNLGGPGSGTQVLREFSQADAIPRAIRERYEIIGFDQRGVGNPLRVDCDEFADTDTARYLRDQGEILGFVSGFMMVAESCSAKYAEQLQWVGSNSVVQDMEVMRTMLNAPKLNIIGASFGTRTTALYMASYPDSAGRIILDAPLPPTGSIKALLADTVAAQQHSFDMMLNACGTTLPDCDRESVEEEFVTRVNALLNNGALDTFKSFFSLLSLAIEEFESGELLAPVLIDYAISGNPTDMFAAIQDLGLNEEDNERITLERAVICADDPERPSVESLVAELQSMNEISDFFAEAVLPVAASCVGWPEALDPIIEIRTDIASAPIVIGGVEDIRTPADWAIETAEATSGILINSGHQGHTTLFVRENECVDSITLDFLLDGTLPPTGVDCN